MFNLSNPCFHVEERINVKRKGDQPMAHRSIEEILGPKLFFVTGLVIFGTAVTRLVCPDLLG